MSSSHRIEHDFFGEKLIPHSAYWSVHTARAVENFPTSGTMISAMPNLIRAFGLVKKAVARANVELGALDAQLAQPIIKACEALKKWPHLLRQEVGAAKVDSLKG